MYADEISESMDEAIKETERRRTIQDKYNKEHNIIPKTIEKPISEVISNKVIDKVENKKTNSEIETEMKKAAANMDFERAMELRDILFELKENVK